MKKQLLYIFILSTSLFTSCAPSLYFPDKVVTTGFSGKNQAFINTSIKPQAQGSDSSNRIGSPTSFAASAGYSFTKNIAAYGSYNNIVDRTVQEIYQKSIWSWHSITGGIFNGNRYEVGLVYFNKFGENELFECSGGYSFGDVKRTSDFRPQMNFDTKYYTVFVQPSWGVKMDNFIFSGGAKLWYQRFTEFNATAQTTKLFNSGNKPFTQLPYFFFNPFMNFEGGIKFIKFNAQLGFPIHYRLQTSNPVLIGFPLYLTVGLTFRIEKDIFSDIKSIARKKHTNENLH